MLPLIEALLSFFFAFYLLGLSNAEHSDILCDPLAQAICLPMISKMILSPKRFTTDFTAVRAFVRVRALMYKQVVGFCEMSPTVFANKLFLRSVKQK